MKKQFINLFAALKRGEDQSPVPRTKERNANMKTKIKT